MDEWDILIAGAGPAGLAAGVVFAGSGLKTLVCDKKQLPVDKPCGEGVMPTGAAALRQLGVRPWLVDGTFSSFKGIRFYSQGGRCAAGVFREGPGWGMPRVVLSSALFQRAQSQAGLEIWEDTPLETYELNRGRVRAQLAGTTVSARLLVGADGLHSRVRRLSGIRVGPRRYHRWGIRQHFQIRPWSDFVEVYWSRGAEAYVTPGGRETVNIAILWSPGDVQPDLGGSQTFNALLNSFPALQARLNGAPAAGLPSAVGPLQQDVASPVADGVLLIGDAAGYLDALTGEGISLAFTQALALKQTVVPQFTRRTGALSAVDLADYRRSHAAIVRPYQRLTRLMLAFSRHPAGVDAAVYLLSRAPVLFQHLLSANMGTVPLGWWWKEPRFPGLEPVRRSLL